MPPASSRPVDKLFDVLLTMYGRHWLDLWTETPLNRVKDAWQAGLAGISDEAIRAALDHLNRNNKFPPTLPEFVGICRQFRPEQRRALPPPREHGPIPPSVQAALDEFKAGKPGVGWARKIMANPGNYPSLSVQYAKEALGFKPTASHARTVEVDCGTAVREESGERPFEPGEMPGIDGMDPRLQDGVWTGSEGEMDPMAGWDRAGEEGSAGRSDFD
jgi:hypothetical protein